MNQLCSLFWPPKECRFQILFPRFDHSEESSRREIRSDMKSNNWMAWIALIVSLIVRDWSTAAGLSGSKMPRSKAHSSSLLKEQQPTQPSFCVLFPRWLKPPWAKPHGQSHLYQIRPYTKPSHLRIRLEIALIAPSAKNEIILLPCPKPPTRHECKMLMPLAIGQISALRKDFEIGRSRTEKRE
jgi:hypothetical protein